MKNEKIINGIEFYSENIRKYEPFKSLEIRAIEVIGTCCEFRNFNDPSVQFFSLYGVSKYLIYCLADCSTLEQAQQLADAFNVFSGFNLQTELVKEI